MANLFYEFWNFLTLCLIFNLNIKTFVCAQALSTCQNEFHGFGVHLGSIKHFNKTNELLVKKVIDLLYQDVKLRHFRISYEHYFSTSPRIYNISCPTNNFSTCTWAWESILKILSVNRHQYPNITLFASIWSPPHYMKNSLTFTLKSDYEQDYYYFIKNITHIISQKWGLTVDKISPVNEPENVFAPWDHLNMDPIQLCNLLAKFNDPQISICPENSYWWITQTYLNIKSLASSKGNCLEHCRTIATHSYQLETSPFSPNFGLAAYDLGNYEPLKGNTKPIWMTEVSSTFNEAENNQMDEALDLATNIVHWVGTTCVERYYYWLAYTNGPSGESLIWGKAHQNKNMEFSLIFPKKYFVYKQFTNAAAMETGHTKISSCNQIRDESWKCLVFSNKHIVFVNAELKPMELGKTNCSVLCCTTKEFDYSCDLFLNRNNLKILPPRSVCTCMGYNLELPVQIKVKAESTLLEKLNQIIFG